MSKVIQISQVFFKHMRS